VLGTDDTGQVLGERIARERPRGENDRVVGRPFGDAKDLGGLHVDARVPVDLRRHEAREGLAIDGERTPRRDLRRLGTREDERARATELLLEEPDRIDQCGPAHRVGADQLAEVVGRLRRSATLGLLLEERHVDAALGELEGRLATRESGADDGGAGGHRSHA